jgi:iron complex outermembrane receptor protein
VPGVSFNSIGASEGLDNISIRGISSTSGSATVGIYLDDVSITVKNFFDGSSQPKLFDIDRIEVLRGPQGTLYGASSMGGTIRFVTKQPDLDNYSGEFQTDLSGTVHGGVNYKEGRGRQRTDRAGQGGDPHQSGLQHRQRLYRPLCQYRRPGRSAGASGVNKERALMLRTTGKLLLSDDTTVTPGLFFQRDKADDNAAFYPALGLWKQDKQVDEYGRDTMFLPSLTVTHDLGFADLTSVTAISGAISPVRRTAPITTARCSPRPSWIRC